MCNEFPFLSFHFKNFNQAKNLSRVTWNILKFHSKSILIFIDYIFSKKKKKKLLKAI